MDSLTLAQWEFWKNNVNFSDTFFGTIFCFEIDSDAQNCMLLIMMDDRILVIEEVDQLYRTMFLVVFLQCCVGEINIAFSMSFLFLKFSYTQS